MSFANVRNIRAFSLVDEIWWDDHKRTMERLHKGWVAEMSEPRWYVLQIDRHKMQAVMDYLSALEFPSLFPMLRRVRVSHGRITADEVLRFGPYAFARFDTARDPWGHLHHSKAKRSGVVRVLCNAQMKPSPVPDEAIRAMKDYQPEAIVHQEPYRYQTGEACTLTIAGRKCEAVFVGYCGNRPMVRTWIFGAEHVTEVATCELEPRDIDKRQGLAAT